MDGVPTFVVGSRIESLGSRVESGAFVGKKWYKGKVKCVKRNGKFSVVSDDGNIQDDMLACHLRLFVDEEVQVLQGPSRTQKARGHQEDAMHIVRGIQLRLEFKKDVMEQEEKSTRGVMRSSSLWWKLK
jgi:hypothetical protein